jgi:hypothetical protein
MRRKPNYAAIAVAALVLLASVKLFLHAHRTRSHSTVSIHRPFQPLQYASAGSVDLAAPVPRELLLHSLEKRVLGRPSSAFELEQVQKVAAPIIQQSLSQPSVQGDITAFAHTLHLPDQELLEQWAALQRADIYLESGGNANAISPAGACGIAQWMAGPGKKMGLKIDAMHSKQLTQKIEELSRLASWYAYMKRPEYKWDNPLAPALNPQTHEEAERQQGLVEAQLPALLQKRARIDERFDPEKAIFAQTRYLLALAHKLPDPSWLFQAYHGGEAGAERLIKKWMGAKYQGTVASAILRGDKGNPLTFETVYFTSGPTRHKEAFEYMYSRGDDHRHYWWKLLTAAPSLPAQESRAPEIQPALTLGVAPGTIWYGTEVQGYRDAAEVQKAVDKGELERVKPAHGLQLALGGPLNSAPASPECACLSRAASAALRDVLARLRKCGGKQGIVVTKMCRTQALETKRLELLLARNRMQGTGASDPNFYTLGAAFDLKIPEDKSQKHLLDYVLGEFEDRTLLLRGTDRRTNTWQIVVNPAYRDLLKSNPKAIRPAS